MPEGASQPASPGELHLASSSKRIPELDGLRGLAILLVILCHYFSGDQSAGFGFIAHYFLRALAFGWSGVDLFFVLSGFLIGGILLESRNSPNYFRTFYLRRIHRILPIYYCWILMYLLGFGAVYLFKGNSGLQAADLWSLPLYFVFLQNFIHSKSIPELTWLGVLWSLAIEEQFYLCAPGVIRYVSTRHLVRLLGAVVLLAPFLRLLIYVFSDQYRYLAIYALPCRADALSLGMLGAVAWQQPAFRLFLQKRPGLMRSALLVSLVFLALLLYWLLRPAGIVVVTAGYSALALFYLCLLLFVLSYSQSWLAVFTRLKPLRALGTVSYCVYIIHAPTLVVIHWAVLHRHPHINDAKGFAVTLLAALTACGLAALSWRFLEKPLLRRGHRFTY
jgi:peptidoglycan/LPS O-acetylase OafA/YrhL